MVGENIPDISIIIASKNGRETIEECLSSIRKQKKSFVEIVVADQSTDGSLEIVKKNFPDIKLIEISESLLIPELWGEGIRASSGKIVALTTSNFIPANNWIDKIKESLKPPYSAVGGAIENSSVGSLGDWALYFCRYSNYMLPFEKKDVNDMAADNAAYSRKALEPYKEFFKNGFWENFINSLMIKDGLKILQTPDIVVVHKKSFNILSFSKQRFLHGSFYGEERSKSFTLIKRLIFVLASPLIPLIHLRRISKRVYSRKRHIAKFLQALPVLVLFIVCWSAGEFCGYLSGILKSHEKL